MNDGKYDEGLGSTLNHSADYLVIGRETLTFFSGRNKSSGLPTDRKTLSWDEMDFSNAFGEELWAELGAVSAKDILRKVETILVDPMPSYPIFQSDNIGHIAHVNHLTDPQLSGFFEAELLASILNCDLEGPDSYVLFKATQSRYIYVIGIFTEGERCRVTCVIRPQDNPFAGLSDSDFIDRVIARMGIEELPNAIDF